MSRTISLSDPLYVWLQDEAQKRGLSTIEELLEVWKAEGRELDQRREVVDEIIALSDRLAAKYGKQSDSVDLIREDRER